MKKNKKGSVQRTTLLAVATLMVATCVVGIVLSEQKANELPQGAVTSPTLTPTTLQDVTYISDPASTNFVLAYPVIVSDSIKVAEVDITGDGKNDVRVAFYDLDYDASLQVKSAFRVYSMRGDVLYEDSSSLWSRVPTLWRIAEQSDLDRNGDPELLITGTYEGTGAYTHQRVLDFTPNVGLVEIPVIASKTATELAQEILQNSGGVGSAIIGADGTGSRGICPPGGQCSRQSIPNSPGAIKNDYIYDPTRGFVETNYRRVDY